MQHEFQPEENQTPFTVKPAAPLITETEANAQAVADITKRLDEITRRANRVLSRTGSAVLIVMTCWLIASCLISFFFGPHNPARQGLVLPLGGAMVILLSLIILGGALASPRFDANEIARIGGVKAIAPLCVTLETSMPIKQRRAIHNALILLLPQLKVSEANLLPPITYRYIYSCLRLNGDGTFVKRCPTDLRIAALKALEQVGDARAVPLVERLTKMRLRTQARLRVKQAAIECLPMLKANCGEVEAARTLLRASHAEAARPDTLLRPASGAGQTATQELLRPSDTE